MSRDRGGLEGRLVRSYLGVIALTVGVMLALYGLAAGLLLYASRTSETGAVRILAAEIARLAGPAAAAGRWTEVDAAIGRVLSAGVQVRERTVVLLSLYRDSSAYDVSIVDRSLRFVHTYRSVTPRFDISSPPRRGLVEGALSGRTGLGVYLPEQRRSVAVYPLADTAGAVGLAVCVESPATGGFLRDLAVLLAAGGVFLIAVSVLSALVAAGVATRAARLISDPLRGLAEASRRIAQGSREAPPLFRTGDEIERLSRDMSAMTLSLAQTMEGLEDERERVRALLKAKQDLVASVSHDLRTPLATLKTHLEALEEKGLVESDLGRGYLEIAQAEADRLEALIDDLFLLTRLENAELPLALCPVSPQELLPGLCAGFGERSRRDKRITVVWVVTPDCPPMLADRQRLEQVLGNLLSNALRYTPEGGVIRVAASPDGPGARLDVQDTGIGISVEDLPHVFDRFYKGEKSRSRSDGGSGLGLSIAKELVERQGGRIAVQSAPGEGTTFSVYLRSALVTDEPGRRM